MVRFFLLVLVLPGLIVSGQNEPSVWPQTLSAYDEYSASLPKFLGARPNGEYFKTPLDTAIEQRNDFTLSISLDHLLGEATSTIDQTFLSLANPGDGDITICISAVFSSSNEFINFLVRLPPGEFTTLDATDFLNASKINFVCIQGFHASITAMAGDRQYVDGADALMPLRFSGNPGEEGIGYCRSFNDILRVEHISGPYEDAWFVRSKIFNGFHDCTITEPPKLRYSSDKYEINVYWPTANTLHHGSDGAWSWCTRCHNTFCPPKCLANGYLTEAISDGTLLYWRHIDYIEAVSTQNTPDDVFFGFDCGKAYCSDQLAGKCLDDPSWFWYFYKPGNRPNCF